VQSSGLAKNQTMLKPLLGKLIKWTVLAILFVTLAALGLYVIGSYRKVSDESQLTLVRFCLGTSMLLIISAIYGFILDLYYAVRRKKASYLVGALGYMLIMVFGASTALGAAFIIGAVGGNR